MNNLTESDIKYLRDCVLSSTLLGHEVKKGSEVLRKLDKALSLGAVVGRMCEHQNNLDGKTAKDYLQDFLSQ